MSHRDDEKEFQHESYVMAGFSRITGSPGRLFGSSVAHHQTFIRLTIRRAKRIHNLGRDWYHGDSMPIVEVDLSAAQFAEMLTGMNVGSGVPCTLRWIDGKKMGEPPDEMLEAEQVKTDFKEKLGGVAKKLDAAKARLQEVLAKKNLTQADRKDVQSHVDSIIQEVRSNLPFWLSQFHEATEKVVTAAKAEVDAFMTHAVMAAGWKSLKEDEGGRPPALPPGPELGGTEGQDDKNR